MEILKNPTKESYGMCYIPRLTDEFKMLIESAKEKIKPYSHKEISQTTTFFKVKGEEVSGEFDCCDNEKCIKKSKEAIRKQYGKGIHIEECYYDNDGDHENIETCNICGKPLNEWLTYADSELEYLEENKPWDIKFLKDQGFLISSILHSSPTMDCDISSYDKYQGADILKEALESREKFFRRIELLVNKIIEVL